MELPASLMCLKPPVVSCRGGVGIQGDKPCCTIVGLHGISRTVRLSKEKQQSISRHEAAEIKIQPNHWIKRCIQELTSSLALDQKLVNDLLYTYT